jgi:uncharacterized membrane protein
MAVVAGIRMAVVACMASWLIGTVVLLLTMAVGMNAVKSMLWMVVSLCSFERCQERIYDNATIVFLVSKRSLPIFEMI